MGELMAALQHSPANVVRWLLVALGLGADPTVKPLGAWPVYWPTEPDLPDNAITVYRTTGTSHGRAMFDGEVFENHGFQVRVRSTTDPVGLVKVEAVRDALAKSVYDEQVTVSGTQYLVNSVVRIGQVREITKDVPTSKRSIFTLNAQVNLRQL